MFLKYRQLIYSVRERNAKIVFFLNILSRESNEQQAFLRRKLGQNYVHEFRRELTFINFSTLKLLFPNIRITVIEIFSVSGKRHFDGKENATSCEVTGLKKYMKKLYLEWLARVLRFKLQAFNYRALKLPFESFQSLNKNKKKFLTLNFKV